MFFFRIFGLFLNFFSKLSYFVVVVLKLTNKVKENLKKNTKRTK